MIIAAMSDLHGYLPEIPPCDLLIVAGDVCPDRFGPFYAMHAPEHQKRWFDAKFRPWVAAAPRAVLTWGNHDYCGQVRYWFEDDDLVAVDRVVEVNGLKIWLSPWSNRFGCWAFMDDPEDLGRIYAQIPDDVDIIVSHQPPYGCGDRIADFSTGQMEHIGSRELLEATERVRPKLVVCGHIHCGRGVYDLDGIPVINCAIVDEDYRPVPEPAIVYEWIKEEADDPGRKAIRGC